MTTQTNIKVTGVYRSERDGRWYLTVTHGCMVEHDRLHVNDLASKDEVIQAAVDILTGFYKLKMARARLLVEGVMA